MNTVPSAKIPPAHVLRRRRETPVPTPLDLAVLAGQDDYPVLVVDVETTGLDPREDRIVEIAAVRVHHGRVVGYWNQLVDPQRPLPQTAARLTGIDEQTLRAQPAQAWALGRLAALARNAVIVAHNAPFEQAFLARAAKRSSVELSPAGYACTLRLAAHVHWPENQALSLAALCQRHNIRNTRPHRALPDAKATPQLLRALRNTARHATRHAA